MEGASIIITLNLIRSILLGFKSSGAKRRSDMRILGATARAAKQRSDQLLKPCKIG